MLKQFALFLCCVTLFAHPMGNFSVSHYSKLEPTTHGVDLQYVLDLAEIPTFELLRTWNVDRSAPSGEIQKRAVQQSREWLRNLKISADGRPIKATVISVKPTISDGAGTLPIVRVDMRAHLETDGGSLEFEDANYPERAGWKEIVIVAGSGESILRASQSDKDLSHALSQYPPDPTIAPPQELRAELHWQKDEVRPAPGNSKPQVQPATVTQSPSPSQPPIIKIIPQPQNAPPAAAPATLTLQGAKPGSIARGDFLSRLLQRRELSFSMILIALAASFGLGAAHALTPGHGKTIVAAYLVGSRGTFKHAAFLGAMVTFTHTISVFALGLATLFLFRFIVPEQITAILGAISGLGIVVVGAFMLYKRIRQTGHVHSHGHLHSHDHSHTHVHSHEHVHSHVQVHASEVDHVHPHDHSPDHPHGHDHSHDDHHHHGVVTDAHSHGLTGKPHSHLPDQLSWAGLIALGASGGLVPCESALILLLGAIALGRVGFGLLLLLSFSIGLALVLMLIGVIVLYARTLLPQSSRSGTHPLFRWMSLASPAIVMIVGILMTAASLGWIQSKWMIG